jgi:uncharacterized protein YfaT (DUF1175 family)
MMAAMQQSRTVQQARCSGRRALRLAAVLALLLCSSGVLAGSPLDSRGAGLPDATRIIPATDRVAFREWFAAVAEAQYTAPAPAWQDRDCSSLLRFAYVEALKPKTADWFARFPFLIPPGIAPPRTPGYPLPLVRRSVFRIAPGAYEPGDVEAGRIVGAATSAELMRYNTDFLGRTPEAAERGDLLFFAHPLAEGSGYHSMIYLGDGMVVYHTGATPEEGGEVRLLSLETLARHPDASWHPVPGNPHFLGFYRWRIIT